MGKTISPVLAGMLAKAEEIRQELTTYGENLESSTVQSEQTNSYEIATNALNSFEGSLKALAYDEAKRMA